MLYRNCNASFKIKKNHFIHITAGDPLREHAQLCLALQRGEIGVKDENIAQPQNLAHSLWYNLSEREVFEPR